MLQVFMHILLVSLVSSVTVWGLFNLYKDIKQVRSWRLDRKNNTGLGDLYVSDVAGSNIGDTTCHAAHAAGEVGSCDVSVGADFGHFFYH
jgi:hypothetical protein